MNPLTHLNKTCQGFTLIELMIVIAIIGILASVALPSYHDYINRAKLIEAITLTEEIKKSINAYYRQRGKFPSNNEQAGSPDPEHIIGLYTKSATVDKGAIHVQLGNRVNESLKDKILSLRPLIVTANPSSPISWSCGYAGAPPGMTAMGENRTDIENQLLPAACRPWID